MAKKQKAWRRREVAPDKKSLERAIEILGGQAAAARRLNVSQAAINQWLHVNNVPAERCADIEELTEGQVTCKELRPDVFRLTPSPAGTGRPRQEEPRRPAATKAGRRVRS